MCIQYAHITITSLPDTATGSHVRFLSPKQWQLLLGLLRFIECNELFEIEMSTENATQVFKCPLLCWIDNALIDLIGLLLQLLNDVIQIYFYGFVDKLLFYKTSGLQRRTQLK